ncbi:MAG: hypothetical protein QOH31_223, partial [Verrucomicrobiota bacterium]
VRQLPDAPSDVKGYLNIFLATARTKAVKPRDATPGFPSTRDVAPVVVPINLRRGLNVILYEIVDRFLRH